MRELRKAILQLVGSYGDKATLAWVDGHSDKVTLAFMEGYGDTDRQISQYIWDDILLALRQARREDVLQNPVVLDAGGGLGDFSELLNQKGINCVCLDLRCWLPNPRASQIVGDARKMPFADRSFNIVHCCGLFDDSIYESDSMRLLLEIARVLKTKGVLSVYGYEQPPSKEAEKFFKLISDPRKKYLALWEKK